MSDLARSVAHAFYSRYGFVPQQVAIAPGRVNLIGEHIDYSLYAVCPMALEQACCVAAGITPPVNGGRGRPAGSTVSGGAEEGEPAGAGARMEICNVDAATYPSAALDLGPGGMPPRVEECAGWVRYTLAAAHGAWEHLTGGPGARSASGYEEQGAGEGGRPSCRPRGLQRGDAAGLEGADGSGSGGVGGGACEGGFAGVRMMVGGDIPPGAGLASSSALVVATALALLALEGSRPPPEVVADLTRRCERLVGTEGGGMDQAISLLAQPGRAALIGFEPLRATPVELPPGAAFVVADSMAPSLKAETADTHFNLRVLECRLAAALLARKASGASPEAAATVRSLREVEAAIEARFGPGLEGQLRAVEELLPQGACSQEQVERELGMPLKRALGGQPRALSALAAAAAGGGGLRLQDRAAHVFAEARRVLDFRAAAEAAAAAAAAATAEPAVGAAAAALALAPMGALMDASHASCVGLYACSCPELDELAATARDAGALGARLTGAGWGGCVVALVPESRAPALEGTLRRRYYAPRGAPAAAAAAAAAGAGRAGGPRLFTTRPAGGARLLAAAEIGGLLAAGSHAPTPAPAPACC